MGWLGLIGIFLLVYLVLPWVNLGRINRLERKIWLLERRLADPVVSPEAGRFRRAHEPPPEEAGEIVRQPPPVMPTPSSPSAPGREPPPESASAAIPPSVPPVLRKPAFPETRQREERSARPRLVSSFEVNVGAKLPVWIGSVAIIFAAFFLIRHAVEIGWLTESVRVILGALFGVALVAGSLGLLKYPVLPNARRIAQGMAGAGIVVLYVALFAAASYYQLIPALAGFAGMVVVTGAAVVLSLRHGQPIAAFGLIGGLLTPALINAPEPSAVGLFGYLFALFAGLLFVFSRREWWFLAVVAVAGLFGWSGLWFVTQFTPADSVILILFAVGITGVALAATGRRVREERAPAQAHGLNALALAGSLVTVLTLGVTVELTLLDWSLLWLVGLATLALTFFAPKIYTGALWAVAGVSLAVFVLWAPGVSALEASLVLAGLAAVHVVSPGILMRRVPDPRMLSGLQCAAALALYGAAYFTLSLPAWLESGFGMFWGIASLILASLSAWQAQDVRLNFPKDGDKHRTVENTLVAFYALTASAFLALGITIETPFEYMPHAFALQLLATALTYRQTGIVFLENIMLGLTVVLAGLYYEQIFFFLEILVRSISNDAAGWQSLGQSAPDRPFVMLAVPALLAGAALYTARSRQSAGEPVRRALSGLTIALATALGYTLLRMPFAEPAGFMERGFLTLLLGGSGTVFFLLSRRETLSHLKVWGLVLLHLAMARLIWFDLLILNPVFNEDQHVGTWPVLNGITFVYGAGAALALLAVRSDILNRDNFFNFLYRVAGYAMFFLLVTLNVRQIFAGEDLTGPLTGSAEMYGYSAAWLLAGIALLVFGMMRENLPARISALVFLTLAIGKVFLFDMAELDGLYRIFSFFGLGVCLIAMSAFYSRFMSRAAILSGDEQNEGGVQ